MKIDKRDIFQWDVNNWSRVLRFWEQHVEYKPDMKVLAIGEREGGLSLYFASRDMQVHCTDVVEFPDETRKLHKKYGVGGKIVYQLEDVMNLSFSDNTFDIVCFKSVIGGLETKQNQKKAIEEIYRVLKPGGHLLFAENLKGSKMHNFMRKKFVRWGNRWRYLSFKHDQDLFDKFKRVRFKTFGLFGLFGRSEGQRKVLSGLDAVLNPVAPSSTRYILFGIAEK